MLLEGSNIEGAHWLKSEMSLGLRDAKKIVDTFYSEFDYRGFRRRMRRAIKSKGRQDA
jgi:hypothetical protein